jgi:hypothetical protein
VIESTAGNQHGKNQGVEKTARDEECMGGMALPTILRCGSTRKWIEATAEFNLF